MGGAASLLSGRPDACAWASAARGAALAASALGWSALGPVLARHATATRGASIRGAAIPEDAYTRATEQLRQLVLVTFAVFAVGLVVLWLFADRYWLAPAVLAPALLVPAAPALLLPASPAKPTWTAIWLGTYALVAVVGSAAVFDFYRSLDGARTELLAQGWQAHQIDAGYAQNGRYRYLALPSAAAGEGRNRDVPWVSGFVVSPRTIVNGETGPAADNR